MREIKRKNNNKILLIALFFFDEILIFIMDILFKLYFYVFIL